MSIRVAPRAVVVELQLEHAPAPHRIVLYAGARNLQRPGLLAQEGDLPLRDAAQGAPPGALRGLYEEACDLVPRLQRVADGDVEAFRRRLDDALFAYKAELFARYGLAARGHEASGRDVKIEIVKDPPEMPSTREAIAIVRDGFPAFIRDVRVHENDWRSYFSNDWDTLVSEGIMDGINQLLNM